MIETSIKPPVLDATSWPFQQDPYAAYARCVAQGGLAQVEAPYNTVWVLSHKLVSEVNQRAEVFAKPSGNRLGDRKRPFSVVNHLDDGLFFMDGERHAQARKIMDRVFKTAVQGAEDKAREVAERLLTQALKGPGQLDAIRGYAGRLAMEVFFHVMGIDAGPGELQWTVVDNWIRTALASHDESLPPGLKLGGANATLAMRPYFLGLCAAARKQDPAERATIAAGMGRATGCPASADLLNPDESMNTASHMALGGYLSTEFLIGSGLYNLLRHPEQWRLLRENDALVPRAIDEMLRYDAPFQLADRWVTSKTELGGFPLEANQMVAVVYGAANRDPLFCPNPERFDITRTMTPPNGEWGDGIPPATPNVGFGDGVHRCIGEHLGRLVTAAALRAMIKLCPNVRIGEVGPWAKDPYFRSLTKLQLLLR